MRRSQFSEVTVASFFPRLQHNARAVIPPHAGFPDSRPLRQFFAEESGARAHVENVQPFAIRPAQPLGQGRFKRMREAKETIDTVKVVKRRGDLRLRAVRRIKILRLRGTLTQKHGFRYEKPGRNSSLSLHRENLFHPARGKRSLPPPAGSERFRPESD